MQQLLNNRWYAFAEIVFVLIISGLIVARPQWGSWLVILVLLPGVVHLVFQRITFKGTAFVVPVVLFILTAGIGVWAAYDQRAAAEKFWVILGAVAIFVALVYQPKVNLGVVASLVGLVGVIIAIIFLITNDWSIQSSDLELIKRAGEWIMVNRPRIDGIIIPPNLAGGMLAIIAPIPIAISLYYWREGKPIELILSFGMGIVILGVLFLTSSRGAWIALLVGAATWLMWRFSTYLAIKTKKRPLLIFGLLLLITILPLMWVISVLPDGIVSLAEGLPGLPTGGSRYELAVNSAKLIGDYPILGGGLRSFPGQYSQYILVIPYFLFGYSHNFFLDVTFEQGIIGGLALMALTTSAALILMAVEGSLQRRSISFFLSAAVIISTFTLLVHGLVDDPLYGDRGSPLLLLIPGFAILLSKNITSSLQPGTEEESNQIEGSTGLGLPAWAKPAVVLMLLVAGFLVFRKPISASWNANLGAINMAKQDLADWPQNQWAANPVIEGLESAQLHFERAAAQNPQQRTAWHRSALIAVQARDFDIAQENLERAHQIDPDHRGIRKSLGYIYAWNGDLGQAAVMLEGIDEAQAEMEVYTWWWQENNQPELAKQAGDLARMLKRESSNP